MARVSAENRNGFGFDGRDSSLGVDGVFPEIGRANLRAFCTYLVADIMSLPLAYWLCLLLVFGGGAYALFRIGQPWSAPFIAVLGLVAGWYMIEPVYFPDYLEMFSDTDVGTAFACVLTFLIAL